MLRLHRFGRPTPCCRPCFASILTLCSRLALGGLGGSIGFAFLPVSTSRSPFLCCRKAAGVCWCCTTATPGAACGAPGPPT